VRQAAVAAGASPGMCLYQLFDEVAERYLTLVDAFDDDIDELEDKVEEWPAGQLRSRISELRHDILHVRRTLAPTRDAARSVLDDRIELEGGVELFPRDVEIHFADAYDKLLRATDGLDLSRDLLAGVRDYHQAQVANDQNEVMKRLTVVASVLLLPTFIVGLYGQNLKGIPELRFHYGYAWSWALIVLTTIGQIIYFRRKRWI
jgi:magnesium transporter